MRGLVRFFGVILIGCATLVAATLTLTFVKHLWSGGITSGAKPHVSVIDLQGGIWNAGPFLRQLEDKLNDPNTKALVVRINSPGGLVGPSQEIFDALRKADAKIPVIASLGPLAASGGYYAALGARKIFANPGTLTASIGVIMEFVNTQKLFEWAKVERFTLKAGKLKDVGSPLRPMTPEEKDFLNRLLHDVHSQFRGTVKERRKLSNEELDNCADGRVMTGSQAKEAKLVDVLGGSEEAILDAKKLAALPDDSKVEYPHGKRGLIRELLIGEDGDEAYDSFLEWVSGVTASTNQRWRILLMAPF